MSKISTFGSSHIRACLFGLGRLLRTPFTTFLTVAVIAVALALPTSLYVILQNVQGLSKGWSNNSTQLALYLQTNLAETQTQDLLRQLRSNPEIANVQYISPQQGLKEFAKIVGSEKVVESLTTNPLPGVIMIQPVLSLRSPVELEKLAGSLQQLPEINMVKLDMQWLQRFNSILDLVQHAVLALGFLLAIGVLLIIGNTIRLATQNERREISVLKLVGATDAFIRRPFLYIGIWYGFFGGILSWLLVNGVLWWLRPSAASLASTYSSDFYLRGLTTNTGIDVLIVSIFLGLAGAWAAVSRNLRAHS